MDKRVSSISFINGQLSMNAGCPVERIRKKTSKVIVLQDILDEYNSRLDAEATMVADKGTVQHLGSQLSAYQFKNNTLTLFFGENLVSR